MKKTIREIMGKGREKFSVHPTESIRRVAEFMRDKNVGAVAICDGDSIVGVFSERDLLRRVVLQGIDIETATVSEVMTSPVNWIYVEESCEVAKAVMVDKGHRHLVVKDNQQRFIGFVSSRELLEADLESSQELVGKLNDGYYEHRFQP